MEKCHRFRISVSASLLLLVAGAYLSCVSNAEAQEKPKAGVTEKALPMSDEKTKAKLELTAAKSELTEYSKQVSESAEFAEIKKSMADLDAALKAKQKELEAVLDLKLNKDPAFMELVAKKKTYDKIVSDLGVKRNEAGKDPKVKAIRKEAAELKAKSDLKTKEANRIVDAKYNADPVVKALLPKKAALANASKDVTAFRDTAMKDPSVKALREQVQEASIAFSDKKSELKALVAEKMEADPKYAELADKVRMLTEKVTGKKMPPMEGMGPAGAGMPGPGPGQQAQAPAIDQATEKKLAAELSTLLSLYEKNKIELETAISKIKEIMDQLPPDSPLYKNTKSALSKIGTPKARVSGAK